MTIKQQIITLIPLVVIVAGLFGYNFMSAQWQAPTATAPNNNTEAPINISANYQAKLGDLGAVRMRAGEYCDAAGNNCVTTAGIGGVNMMASMRAAGYAVPDAPAGLAKDEWPNAIICEQSNSPFVLRLHQADTEVRYRDSSGTRNYTFAANGNYSNRSDIMGGCSVFSAGGNLSQICAAGLCVY